MDRHLSFRIINTNMLTRHLVSLWVTLTVAFHSLHAVPVLVSESQTVVVAENSPASFTCSIQDPGVAYEVSWYSVNEDIKLQERQDQMYSFSTRIDPTMEGVAHFTLLISSIQHADQGAYQCHVTGSDVTQLHFLQVLDAPEKPDISELPPHNFSECCISNGVSEACQPLCQPATLDVESFNSAPCLVDLPFLVQCGADGRNHAGCCSEKGVPSHCLEYCRGDLPASFQPDEQQECYDRALDIIQCFQEGHNLIPGKPRFPMLSVVSSTALHVQWEPPLENSDLLTGYRLYFKATGEDQYNYTTRLSSSQQSYELTGLRPSTEYTVYVTSLGQHGTSAPSERRSARTYSAVVLPPGVDDLELLDCCARRGVSPLCQGFLCGGPQLPLTAAQRMACYADIDPVFVCLSDEKNHSVCCSERGVPDTCLPLCTGQVSTISSGYENLGCLDYMPDVVSCIAQSQGTLPPPPRQLRLLNVQSTQALFNWSTPAVETGVQVRGYTVHWRVAQEVHFQTAETAELRYLLDGLTPSTEYEVQVSSRGDRGSSLPTAGLHFLTYYEDGGVGATDSPDTATPSPDGSLVTCCSDSGLSDTCLALCDFRLSMESDISASTLIGCAPQIGHVLKCAADGRNHSTCCERKNMRSSCLRFCAFTQADAEAYQVTLMDVFCLPHLPEITQCMQQGADTLPGPPQGVYVVSYTEHTVSVAWSPPQENSNLVNGYFVVAESDDIGYYTRSHALGTTELSYIVHDLDPGTEYMLYILAVSPSGESLPSEAVSVYTRDDREALMNISIPANLTECCVAHGISPECAPVCAKSSLLNFDQCGSQLGIIMTCASDGRDHRACCRERRVYSHCTDSFCTGQPEVTDTASLMCLGYTEQILACFSHGYDKLPLTPENFHLLSQGPYNATFVWSDPSKAFDGSFYTLYYRHSPIDIYTYIRNVTSPYTLRNLRPTSVYYVYVVTENEHGASLPTQEVRIYIQREDVPDLQLSQVPRGKIPEHGPVSLHCWTEGSVASVREMYWVRIGQIVRNDTLVINKISRADTGRYTCVVFTNTGRQISQDLYIAVQFQPTATAVQPIVHRPPDQDLTARLECEFTGQPDEVAWYKDNRRVLPTEDTRTIKITTNLIVERDLGLQRSELLIHRVIEDDYGVYRCVGSNSMGQDSANVMLKESVETPDHNPAPPVLDIPKCCADRGVQPACQVACTFDIDIDHLQYLPQAPQCIEDLPRITSCAADGKNHTQCCATSGVPSLCHVFCYGLVQELDMAHLACVPFFNAITDCMQQGHEKLPLAPINVGGHVDEHGFLRVTWEAPDHFVERVTYYELHYSWDDASRVVTLNSSTLTYALSGTHSFTAYHIYVVSRNRWGLSQPSNNITVRTYELYPSPPQNLRGYQSQADPTVLLLRWAFPARNPGSVTHYAVYYGTDGTFKQVDTEDAGVVTQLSGLKPNTEYSVFVMARSDHYSSLRSNNITLTTGDLPKVKANKGMSSGGVVAVAVGVSFALLFVVCLVVGVTYYYFRLYLPKVKHERFENSVHFNNECSTNPHVELQMVDAAQNEACAPPITEKHPPEFHESEVTSVEVDCNGLTDKAENPARFENPLYDTGTDIVSGDVISSKENGEIANDSNSIANHGTINIAFDYKEDQA